MSVQSRTPEQHRLEVAALRMGWPANDNEIVPVSRAVKPSSRHSELREYVPALRWWRFWSGLDAPAEDTIFPLLDAANDNEERGEDERPIKPSPDRHIDYRPRLGARRQNDDALEMARLWVDPATWDETDPSQWQPAVTEFYPGTRCTWRIGGLEFARETVRNQEGEISHRRGELVRYRSGTQWRRPREEYRFPSGTTKAARHASIGFIERIFADELDPLAPFWHIAGSPCRRPKAITDDAAVAYWHKHTELHGTTPLAEARAAHGLAPAAPGPRALPCGAPNLDGVFSVPETTATGGLVYETRLDRDISTETRDMARDILGERRSNTLDAVMVARNLADIGSSTGAMGKMAERSGRRLLLDAARALDDFLRAEGILRAA